MSSPIWKPNVTVAALIERDGRFLLVEEETDEGLRFNQPAGHLDEGESLVAACMREALEETAWHVRPTALVGVYQWPRPQRDITYLRFAFACEPVAEQDGLALDAGIVRAVWLAPEEIEATRSRHRSPLVWQCVQDTLSGRRFPLDLIRHHALMRWWPLVLLLACTAASAEETVDVCFNYSCAAEESVHFSEARLAWVREMLAAANSSERERALLALVVGQLYGWAAEQTPVGNDKAGNYADGGMPGQMDCIDHSTTTTRFLLMIEERGWLRFHRVLDPVRRSLLVSQHFSAAIEDLGDGISVIRTDARARIWAVDSWYADNGKPAWIAPFDKWKRDDGPDI